MVMKRTPPAGDRLIFRHNCSHHAHIGHTLKTRARENHILYNRIMDEEDGDSSYIIDVPNGGLTFIVGNLMQQSPFTDNSDIVSFGAEGLSSGRPQELYAVGNTIVNDLGSGAFFNVAGGTTTFRSVNNLLVGQRHAVLRQAAPGGHQSANHGPRARQHRWLRLPAARQLAGARRWQQSRQCGKRRPDADLSVRAPRAPRSSNQQWRDRYRRVRI
jgi:hypothetical protein